MSRPRRTECPTDRPTLPCFHEANDRVGSIHELSGGWIPNLVNRNSWHPSFGPNVSVPHFNEHLIGLMVQYLDHLIGLDFQSRHRCGSNHLGPQINLLQIHPKRNGCQLHPNSHEISSLDHIELVKVRQGVNSSLFSLKQGWTIGMKTRRFPMFPQKRVPTTSPLPTLLRQIQSNRSGCKHNTSSTAEWDAIRILHLPQTDNKTTGSHFFEIDVPLPVKQHANPCIGHTSPMTIQSIHFRNSQSPSKLATRFGRTHRTHRSQQRWEIDRSQRDSTPWMLHCAMPVDVRLT